MVSSNFGGVSYTYSSPTNRVTHAAFTLGFEAGINKSNIDGNMVPPGALIKFVRKGLQYMELEANLSNTEHGEADIDEDFSFFQPLDLISKDVKGLQEMLWERKRKEKDQDIERSKENAKEVEREHEGDRRRVKEKDRHEKQKEKDGEREKMEREKEREREKMERETFEREREIVKLEREREMEREMEREKIEREKAHEKQLGDDAAEPMDITMTPTSLPCHIPNSDVRILEGHTSEVIHPKLEKAFFGICI